MHVARTVYEKFCNGDPINDDELEEALEFFDNLQSSLMKVGPVFRLSAVEALRVYSALKGYADARAEKARVENRNRG